MPNMQRGQGRGRPRLGVPRDTLPKTWRVTEMSERHHEIARLLLLGGSGKDIARQLNVTPQMVSMVKSSPPVQEHLALLGAERDRETIDIAQQIQEALPKCLALLNGQIDDDSGKVSPSLKSKNAFGLMSIGGFGPSKNVNVKAAYAVLSAEDIVEIKERGEGLKSEMKDITPRETVEC